MIAISPQESAQALLTVAATGTDDDVLALVGEYLADLPVPRRVGFLAALVVLLARESAEAHRLVERLVAGGAS